jgi:ABC-type multidrug transport system permease subunit
MPIAYQEHLPISVDDLRSANPNDASGQGLFFLLVALTVGSYASAIAVAAVTAKVSVGWRLGIGAATAAVVAGIGVIVAGPIYQVVQGDQWGVWLLAWLYSFGIIAIGVGLHPVLGKWTTPVLTGLFVMLNVTSSGGVFPASLMPPLFAGISTFWNGAAWLDAVQSLLYFPGRVFGFDGLRLALWAAAGVGLVLVTHLWSIRKRRLADESIAITEEDEVIAA